MNPILYAPKETDFSALGLGMLPDCITCQVTEERNGPYELEMQYPVDGAHYGEIITDSLIKAKPNETAELQLFRVYHISKPINGVVTINAEHISYRLSHVPVSPFSAGSCVGALAGLVSNSAVEHPFSVWTDISSTAYFKVPFPASFRSLLAGSEGSVLDIYGGEFEWDNYTIKLHAHRGRDNGVTILYGKNLIDVKQEESISDVVTGIYPYWADSDGNMADLPEKTIVVESGYAYPRVVPVDFSQDFDTQPTTEQLRAAADEYMKNPSIGKPSVNITVDFVQLWQTAGYEDIAGLERVALCDTVSVRFSRLGVDAKAKVIKTVYDCLANRYSKIELGDAKATIADTIVRQQAEIEKAQDTSFLEQAISAATAAITGASGGYVVLNPSEHPQEILIMDTPDINTAVNVWRWNSGGLGHSGTGYNGSYSTAMTRYGEIVADKVTAGTLNGSIIRAGRIQAPNNANVYFDLDAGELACTQMVSEYGGRRFDLFLGDLNMGDGNKYGLTLSVSNWPMMKIVPDYVSDSVDMRFASGQSVRFWRQGIFIDSGSETVFGVRGDSVDIVPMINMGTGTGMDASMIGIWPDGSLEPAIVSNKPTWIGWKTVDGNLNATAIFKGSEISFFAPLNMNGHSITNQSDVRLKDNIQPADVDAVALINAIDLKSFDWLETGEHQRMGVIAQQVAEVAPELVDVGDDGVYSIKPLEFIPYLIRAVQQLSSGTEAARKVEYRDPYSKAEKTAFIQQIQNKRKKTKGVAEDANIKNR